MPRKWQKLGKQKICEDLLGGPMRHFPCSSYLSINCLVFHEFNLDMPPVLAKTPRGPGYPSLPESCQNHEVLHHSIQLKPAACKKLLKRSEKIWKALVTKATNHEKPCFRGFSTFASTWTISAARSESLKIYLRTEQHSFQKMWWTCNFHRIRATFLEALPWSPILSAGNVWRIPNKKNDLWTSSLHMAQLKKKR